MCCRKNCIENLHRVYSSVTLVMHLSKPITLKMVKDERIYYKYNNDVRIT